MLSYLLSSSKQLHMSTSPKKSLNKNNDFILFIFCIKSQLLLKLFWKAKHFWTIILQLSLFSTKICLRPHDEAFFRHKLALFSNNELHDIRKFIFSYTFYYSLKQAIRLSSIHFIRNSKEFVRKTSNIN